MADLLPLEEGFSVATCFSGVLPTAPPDQKYVVAITNTSSSELSGAPIGVPGGSHPWERFHNEAGLNTSPPPAPLADHVWNVVNLGEVFGVTLDEAPIPNIYVSATTAFGIYNAPTSNSGDRGSVFKLDGVTGEISVFATLPQLSNGPSLGNLCHHQDTVGNDWIFVSNFEDGNIYRLDSSGAYLPLDVYDHGTTGRVAAGLSPIPDSNSVGLPRPGRRVWGLEDYEGRLYYGVWYNPGTAQEIWSVALDASGAIDPSTAMLEITIPFVPGRNYSLPVADITFSSSGDLLFAERYHRHNNGTPATSMPSDFTGPHKSRVLEYTGTSGAWTASPVTKYTVGSGSNSAGGVAIDCEGRVYASGDALKITWPSPNIYGIQIIPSSGPTTPNDSYLVDIDADICDQDKTQIGEVDILRTQCNCFSIEPKQVECPQEEGAPFEFHFNVTNLSGHPVSAIRYTPCAAGDLPAGAVTLSGPQVNVLGSSLADGDSTNETLTLSGFTGGQTVCFLVTLLSAQGEECCTYKVCVDLPQCDDPCFETVIESIDCEIDSLGNAKFIVTGSLTNLTPFPAHHGTIISATPGVNVLTSTSPSYNLFDWSGAPIAPGDTEPFSLCITGATPGTELCLTITLHNEALDLCCAGLLCFELPDCGQHDEPLDRCQVKDITDCCPQEGVAHISFAICNTSANPRSYNWTLAGTAPTPLCTGTLSPGDFTPGAGVTPVIAPGDCHIVNVEVTCHLEPGQCACYVLSVEKVSNPANHFECPAKVRRPTQWVIKEVAGGDDDVLFPAIITNGDKIAQAFEVTNISDKPDQFDYTILTSGSLELSSEEGSPAGVLRGSLSLKPSESAVIRYIVSPLFSKSPFEQSGVTAFYKVQLLGGSADSGNGTNAFQAENFVQQVFAEQKIAALIVDAVTMAGPNRLGLSFDSTEGEAYKVQFCADLQSGWVDAPCATTADSPLNQTQLEGTGDAVTWFTAVDGSEGFYRVVTLDEALN